MNTLNYEELKELQTKINSENAVSIFQDLLGEAPKNNRVVHLFDDTKHTSEVFRENHKKYGTHIHNYSTGDHYTAVNAYMEAHNLEWKQAVIELGKEYNHLPHDYDNTPHEQRTYKPKPQPTEQERQSANRMLNPQIGEWTPQHLAFWERSGITQKWLNDYNVSPLSSFDFVNIETGAFAYTMRLDKELAFAYRVGKNCVKKYQPQAENKKIKWGWVGEQTQNVPIWGIAQLPEKCAKLLIVEGLKDALSLNANFSEFGIWAVGLDSVGQKINDKDLKALQSKVSNPNDLFLCLDNDKVGREQNEAKAQKYGFFYLPYLSEFEGAKDITDLCTNFEKFGGKEAIKNWLTSQDYVTTPPVSTAEAEREEKTATDSENDNINSQRQIKNLEAYLDKNYAFRINTITDQIEVKKHSEQDFVLLNDITLNSLVREIKHNNSIKKVGKVGKDSLKDLIKSDFSPFFNPFYSYFENLPTLTGTSHIAALAQTLKVGEGKEAYFLKCLTKWLVATVANLFNAYKCENHTCLVLTGAQGIAKTTWLDNLCPPKLKSYLYTGRIVIDESNDNTLRLLNTCFIINIDDQLKKLNHKDEEGVKTIITLPKCRYRRLYSNIIEDLPRNASFVASVNGYDFLTDMTGSRRFLPFEAKAVDRDALQKIDMDSVWAEAYALYKSGSFEWWFGVSDMAELEENNNPFAFQSLESELLFSLYSPTPLYEGQVSIFMQTGEILLRLQETAKGQRLGSKRLGSVLGKHFQNLGKKVNGTTRYGWNVYPNIGSVDAETGELTDYSENFKN